MAKPITELTKDIQKFIEDGRAAAGPEIIFSLQKAGPWWTGNFGRLWVLGKSPIKPVVSNDRDWQGPNMPTSRNYSKKPALRVPIDSPLYIGNSADYAGYAVNNPQAKKDGKTYGEARPPLQITAKAGVDWYKVYTKGGEGSGLFRDLDKGFASVRT